MQQKKNILWTIVPCKVEVMRWLGIQLSYVRFIKPKIKRHYKGFKEYLKNKITITTCIHHCNMLIGQLIKAVAAHYMTDYWNSFGISMIKITIIAASYRSALKMYFTKSILKTIWSCKKVPGKRRYRTVISSKNYIAYLIEIINYLVRRMFSFKATTKIWIH